MESVYSINVTNKFLVPLLADDADLHEIVQQREQEKEAKKKEKLSEKENKSKQPDVQKPTGIKTQKSRVIKDAQQPASKVQDPKKDQGEKKPPQSRTSGGDRNVKFSGDNREERNNRRNREDGERTPRGQGELRRGPPGEGRETREFRNSNDTQRAEYGERRGRGGLRGISRGRGGPRGRGGYDNRGKREFDRQSGSDKTGIKPVDKKDGAGSHNWGTHNDEIEESLNQESQDWPNEKPDGDAPQASPDAKEGEANPDATEEKPAEEEPRELTLDEWKALRNTREKPQYNIRKAGEGEDMTRWKKMYALANKKEGGDDDEEDEEDYDAAAEYPQRVGRQKRVLGIEIQFSDSRRGSGGRGQRRGGRGGERANGRGFGNRGGGAPRDAGDSRGPPPQTEQRSPRGRQNAPKVDDENDFPSLG
ncbi:PREDICTED: plasminogen activator inhibitor 1 RNA-binding protein-like isoform X2 [Dufourea novaeangliae]|uniref:Plasminogen activator inhibitor 1 RNA-binding protein n=1 Tax=Dufourea novaeangliae TaxID=178035 RepID=A0A154PNE9_DUFNO|nr:PREDICTED: plasminogen activator inhibitor 1 RNA-binding protein-like isoform X2 [Dufourea novaeangliae]KZC13362.1 Plasminogen activator inhibitor 1 RNA-binding protein [Dufourea novaeangliae]